MDKRIHPRNPQGQIQMTLTKCDKCKEDIDKDCEHKIVISDSKGTAQEKDLCYDCAIKVKELIEGTPLK